MGLVRDFFLFSLLFGIAKCCSCACKERVTVEVWKVVVLVVGIRIIEIILTEILSKSAETLSKR